MIRVLSLADGGPGLEGSHWLFHVIWQWQQLHGAWNWKTWHLALLTLEYEQDEALPGWEVSVILFGAGVRFRMNFDWSSSPAGRQVIEAQRQLLEWDTCPTCGYGRVNPSHEAP